MPAEGDQWAYQGAFFKSPNETILYRFGGFPPNDAGMTDSVMTYDTVSGDFNTVPVSGGSFTKMSNVQEMAANSVATGEGLGFYTGGFNVYDGMVEFNASDAEHPTWVNRTVGEIGPTAGGQMQFVRLGKKGVLVAVGGYNVSSWLAVITEAVLWTDNQEQYRKLPQELPGMMVGNNGQWTR